MTAYVYPAKFGLDAESEATTMVLTMSRPALKVVRQDRVEIGGLTGWFVEAAVPEGTADAGPPRTAVWLFQLDGWSIKYRVSARHEVQWPEVCRDVVPLIEAIGWPRRAERVASGHLAAKEASRSARAAALRDLSDAAARLLSVALDTLRRGDVGALTELLVNAPRPLPHGLQAGVVDAALDAGYPPLAYELAESMKSDDEESGSVVRWLSDWCDEGLPFASGNGCHPADAVRIDVSRATLRIAAIHQYLRWLLGVPGHIWWLRSVALVKTSEGPREVMRLALRDGRYISVWFDTDLSLDGIDLNDGEPAGLLQWPDSGRGPDGVDLYLAPSLTEVEVTADLVKRRLFEHFHRRALDGRRPQPAQSATSADLFEGLRQLPYDHALLNLKYAALPPAPPAVAALPTGHSYIHHKAFVLAEFGPATYAKDDPFGMPSLEWGEALLDAILSGARQLVDWRGISPDAPLRGLGIQGFKALFRTLHFEAVGQALVGMDEDWALDAMTMRHVVYGWEVTIYNAVPIRRKRQRSH